MATTKRKRKTNKAVNLIKEVDFKEEVEDKRYPWEKEDVSPYKWIEVNHPSTVLHSFSHNVYWRKLSWGEAYEKAISDYYNKENK